MTGGKNWKKMVFQKFFVKDRENFRGHLYLKKKTEGEKSGEALSRPFGKRAKENCNEQGVRKGEPK